MQLGGSVSRLNVRVDRVSATEMEDKSSIPGRVNQRLLKIGIHSFPA